MKKPARKTTRKLRKPAKKRGEKRGTVLIPQKHGGALLSGDSPTNHVSGPGRPPSAIRRALRESFDKRLPVLEKIADSTTPETKDSDRIRAVEVLGKYGLGETAAEHSDIRNHPHALQFVTAYRQALVLELSDDVVQRVLQRVEALLDTDDMR